MNKFPLKLYQQDLPAFRYFGIEIVGGEQGLNAAVNLAEQVALRDEMLLLLPGIKQIVEKYNPRKNITIAGRFSTETALGIAQLYLMHCIHAVPNERFKFYLNPGNQGEEPSETWNRYAGAAAAKLDSLAKAHKKERLEFRKCLEEAVDIAEKMLKESH
ncbi:MAG: hypothetical protein AABX33_06900 [Nanoarchaeota archaeon]